MVQYHNLINQRNHINIWRFFELLGVDPCLYGWNKCVDDDRRAETFGCGCQDDCVSRFKHLNGDYLGADDIYDAIDEAFDVLSDWLGFAVLPTYYKDTLPYPRQRYSLTNIYGQYKQHHTQLGQLIKLGKPEIVYDQDITIDFLTDFQGRFFEISYVTTVDPTEDELILAHTEENRQYEALEDWMLDYISVSIIGVDTDADGFDDEWTVTFKGKQCHLMNPEFMLTGTCCEELDDLTPCYVNVLSVYRIVQDPCRAGKFRWRGENGCYEPCTTDEEYFCGTILEHQNGKFTASPRQCCVDDETGEYILNEEGDYTYCDFCVKNLPDEIDVYYRSGYPVGTNQIVQNRFERALVYLAVSYLTCELPKCECDNKCLYSRIEYWRAPYVIKTSEGDERGMIGNTYRLGMTPNQLEDFPFGPLTNGAVEAFQLLKRYRMRLR